MLVQKDGPLVRNSQQNFYEPTYMYTLPLKVDALTQQMAILVDSLTQLISVFLLGLSHTCTYVVYYDCVNCNFCVQ